jgi:hypothetical protein
MANQIRFKRASGSDPGASDLVLGEPAVRTDTGELFFKKDDGSVAKVSGGGITDGDKGDITVSSSGATFTIDNDAVTYAKIQNVSATNRILGRDSSGAGNIEEITPANLRTMINVEDGATADQSASDILSLLSDQNIATTGSLTIGTDIIHSGDTDTKISFTTDQITAATAGTTRLTVSDSAIQLSLNTTVAGSFTMAATNSNFIVNNNAGSNVFTVNSSSGNVTTSGTVDGRDVAADGTKLDGIESGATADQTASDIKTLLQSDKLTASEIANDTITAVQLANNSANVNVIADGAVTFAKIASVSQNRIAGRVSSGSGVLEELTAANVRSMINVADGATNVTNNNQLTNGAGYITATLTNEQVQDIVGGMLTGNTETGITVTYQDGDGTIDFVVGTLNQDTTGNAATATALETARNIGGVSFDGTANINLPGVNTAGNQNTTGTSGGFTAGSASNLNSGTLPDARFPSTLPAVDGSNLTGISAGATGGGSDEVFYENDQTVTTNYTITNGKNAMSAGPITINSGVTVTVGSGETLTIV